MLHDVSESRKNRKYLNDVPESRRQEIFIYIRLSTSTGKYFFYQKTIRFFPIVEIVM